jgi:hypothetical protein
MGQLRAHQAPCRPEHGGRIRIEVGPGFVSIEQASRPLLGENQENDLHDFIRKLWDMCPDLGGQGKMHAYREQLMKNQCFTHSRKSHKGHAGLEIKNGDNLN